MVVFGEIDLIGSFDFTGHLACLPRHILGVRFRVSGTCSMPAASRLESWEARKPEAMTFLSFQAFKLPSLPAILRTPDT
jgi:hypothetical protein